MSDLLPSPNGGYPDDFDPELADAVLNPVTNTSYSVLDAYPNMPLEQPTDYPSHATNVVNLNGVETATPASGLPQLIQSPYSTPSVTTQYAYQEPALASSAEKIGWSDVFEPVGNNASTMTAFSKILSNMGGLLNKRDTLYDLAGSLNQRADAVRERAEANYRIAAINQARIRGRQGKYLAAQRVTAQRTGFAPTSGSIQAVQEATMSKFEQQIGDAWRKAEQQRQNLQYQASVYNWQASQAKRSGKSSVGSFLGNVVGSVAGGYFGGAQGMSIGSSIGSSLGSSFVD